MPDDNIQVPDQAAVSQPVNEPTGAATQSRYNTKLVIGICLAAGALIMLLFNGIIALLLAVPAVILGHMGAREVSVTGERSPQLATTTLVLGYISLGIVTLALIAGIALAGEATQNIAPGHTDKCTWPTNPTAQQEQTCFDSQNS